jgi:hypothetical protein
MGLCIGVKPGCLINIDDSVLDVIGVDEASIKSDIGNRPTR